MADFCISKIPKVDPISTHSDPILSPLAPRDTQTPTPSHGTMGGGRQSKIAKKAL